MSTQMKVPIAIYDLYAEHLRKVFEGQPLPQDPAMAKIRNYLRYWEQNLISERQCLVYILEEVESCDIIEDPPELIRDDDNPDKFDDWYVTQTERKGEPVFIMRTEGEDDGC